MTLSCEPEKFELLSPAFAHYLAPFNLQSVWPLAASSIIDVGGELIHGEMNRIGSAFYIF